MKVYLTADTHGDFSRLSFKNWKIGKSLNKSDLLIILGDCGLIFDNIITKEEKYNRKWLNNLPFSVAYVCGNHENHPRLNSLPKKRMYGGIVGCIEDSVFHFKRGEVYSIGGKKIFTFGGATSIDRGTRIEHVTWWKEEVATYTEMDYGLTNLETHKNSIDFILAHTAPDNISNILIKKLNRSFNDQDPTRKYLEHVCSTISFKEFYCGHWHVEDNIDSYHFIFKNIVQII